MAKRTMPRSTIGSPPASGPSWLRRQYLERQGNIPPLAGLTQAEAGWDSPEFREQLLRDQQKDIEGKMIGVMAMGGLAMSGSDPLSRAVSENLQDDIRDLRGVPTRPGGGWREGFLRWLGREGKHRVPWLGSTDPEEYKYRPRGGAEGLSELEIQKLHDYHEARKEWDRDKVRKAVSGASKLKTYGSGPGSKAFNPPSVKPGSEFRGKGNLAAQAASLALSTGGVLPKEEIPIAYGENLRQDPRQRIRQMERSKAFMGQPHRGGGAYALKRHIKHNLALGREPTAGLSSEEIQEMQRYPFGGQHMPQGATIGSSDRPRDSKGRYAPSPGQLAGARRELGEEQQARSAALYGQREEVDPFAPMMAEYPERLLAQQRAQRRLRQRSTRGRLLGAGIGPW
jgi:hypothetical protein